MRWLIVSILLFLCYTSCIGQVQFVSRSQFLCIFPNTKASVDNLVLELNKLFLKYDITTSKRIVAFLTQAGVQTEGFQTFEEPTRDDGTNKDCINYPGGCKYKGRGVLLLHGQDIYQKATTKVGGNPNFVENPDAMLEMPWKFEMSGAFWSWQQLNTYADNGDWSMMTQIIARGYRDIGLAQREALLQSVSVCYQPGGEDSSRCGFTYVCNDNDTLDIISTRYRLLPSQIMAVNNITNPNQVFQKGTSLNIPKC